MVNISRLKAILDFRELSFNYYIKYSMIFVLCAFFAFSPLFLNGAGFIDGVDGIEQHYTWFVYEGRWLREIASNILSGKNPVVPQWTFSLGYGADIVTSMSNWIGDPLNLLSAFCPEKWSVYWYTTLWLVRPWLAGIAFSFYCRNRNMTEWAILSAAILYAFSGYTLVCYTHPNFFNPLILFPFVLAGVDRLFERQSPNLLILSSFLSFCSWFYFAYMICLLLGVYCLIRFFFGKSCDRSLIGFFNLAIRILGCVALGALMAAALLIPIVSAQLGSSRLDVNHEIPLLYLEDSGFPAYYFNWASSFIASGNILLESPIGFGILGVLSCIAILHSRTMQRSSLRVLLVTLTMFTLVPIFGWALNGFSYVSNRWMFGYSFCVCLTCAEMLPSLPKYIRNHQRFLIVVLSLILVLAFLPTTANSTTLCINIIAGFALILFFQTTKPSTKKNTAMVFLTAVIVTQVFSMGYYWSQTGLNNATSKLEMKSIYKTEANYPTKHIINNEHEGGVYRFERQGLPRLDNNTLFLNGLSVDFYDNMYNDRIADFNKALEITSASSKMSFHYTDLDARVVLDTIAGVRSYIIPQERVDLLPYGTSNKAEKKTKNFGIFTLPLSPQIAFSYANAIDKDDWDKLTPLDKQWALLSNCVLESSANYNTNFKPTSHSVKYSITKSDNLDYSEGLLTVYQPGESITLHFSGDRQSETYLRLVNLQFSPFDNVEAAKANGSFAKMSPYNRNSLLLADLQRSRWFDTGYWHNAEYALDFSSTKLSKKTQTSFLTNRSNSTTGEANWLINCGYSDKAQTEITISFPRAGEYRVDFEVLCQPLESFDKKATALSDPSISSLKLGTNTVSGELTCQDNRLLYISIPWEEGWTATVDGEEVNVMKANVAFMAIEVPPGSHKFGLTYSNPKITIGCSISAIAWLIYLLLLIVRKSKSKKAYG